GQRPHPAGRRCDEEEEPGVREEPGGQGRGARRAVGRQIAARTYPFAQSHSLTLQLPNSPTRFVGSAGGRRLSVASRGAQAGRQEVLVSPRRSQEERGCPTKEQVKCHAELRSDRGETLEYARPVGRTAQVCVYA